LQRWRPRYLLQLLQLCPCIHPSCCCSSLQDSHHRRLKHSAVPPDRLLLLLQWLCGLHVLLVRRQIAGCPICAGSICSPTLRHKLRRQASACTLQHCVCCQPRNQLRHMLQLLLLRMLLG
jgi:hypothetical protein